MKTFLAFLILWLPFNPAWAGPTHHAESIGADMSVKGPLTVAQILAEVKAKNPGLRAASESVAAAEARIDASGVLDNPELGGELMYVPNGGFITAADEKNWTLKQTVRIPAYYRLQKDVARIQTDIQRAHYHAQLNAVLAEARSAYSMYNHAFQLLGFFQENIAVLRRFAKVAESKYVVGQATQGEVLKAQVELTRMLNMQVMAQQDQETARAMLNRLMDRPAESPLPQPTYPVWRKLKPSYDELLQAAWEQKPELMAASYDVRIAQLVLDQSRADYWPEVMSQYRSRNSASTGRSNDLMVGVALPIQWGALSAREKSAEAELAVATATFAAQRNAIAYELKKQIVTVQANERFVELYDSSVLPQAQQALQVTEASYQSGKASFLDLLDAERLLLQSNLEYHQYLDEHEQALAELEKIVGVRLQEPGFREDLQ